MKTKDIQTLPETIKDLQAEVGALKRALSSINTQRPTEKKLLTLAEVAKYLSKSKSTIYSLTSNREIPHSKVGRRLYFDKDEIDQYVRSGRKLTLAELSSNAQDVLRGGACGAV